MNIAIIGSGISGLACAWYLRDHCDITLFESNDYLGGHTATKTVETDSGQYAIDTGFIVYNDRTYPHFIRFLDELGITGQATEMSFSVCNEQSGLEYNGHNLSTLFAQKRNLLNPRFYHFIREILRFNRLAKNALNTKERFETLGQFLDEHAFSGYFCQNYILPMGAAIWSTATDDMRDFPLDFFLRFFLNHGLLDVNNRPQWYVIPGGSNSYIKAMEPKLSADIKLNSRVKKVQRINDKIIITTDSQQQIFDEVIFACHSDQALSLLSDANHAEQNILSAITYQKNDVILHTDTALLPKAKRAWAAWNFRMTEQQQQSALPKLTYNMNILQGIDAPETFCVSLNDSEAIHPDSILGQYRYAHPQYTLEAISAQQQRYRINGLNHSWFCGAYWYNGFHEDGLRSALDVVKGVKTLMKKSQFSEANYE
jgi:predicted NAD/FAD-binding protein